MDSRYETKNEARAFHKPNKIEEKSNDLIKISNNRSKIMGVASLWILIFHCWLPVLNNHNCLSNMEIFIKKIGFCGVDIFLLLSGMGLVNSLKFGKKHYYYNRFKKILLTYIISSFFAIIIYKWNLLQAIQKIFFYNYFKGDIYSYLWFVPTIIIFYLLFPIYYKLFDYSKNKNYFIILSIGIWFVIAYLLKGYINEIIYGIINRIPIFITGIWLSWFAKEKKFKFKKIFLIINVAILIIGLQLSYLTTFKDYYILLPISNSLINYPIALTLTILLAEIFSLCSIKCINSFFEFYGTISFQLYCIQETFFSVLITIYLKIISIPAILFNILFIMFVTFFAKKLLLLDNYIWNKIEAK